jgi:hypothetical protein
MNYSFATSPTLCEVLEANQTLYSDSLWEVGRQSCQSGLSPASGASAVSVEAANQGTDWPIVIATLLAALVGAIIGGMSTYIASKRTTVMQLRASLRIKMYDVILPTLRANYGNWRIDEANETGYQPPASLDNAFITEVEELHRTGVVIGGQDRLRTKEIRDKIRERTTAAPGKRRAGQEYRSRADRPKGVPRRQDLKRSAAHPSGCLPTRQWLTRTSFTLWSRWERYLQVESRPRSRWPCHPRARSSGWATPLAPRTGGATTHPSRGRRLSRADRPPAFVRRLQRRRRPEQVPARRQRPHPGVQESPGWVLSASAREDLCRELVRVTPDLKLLSDVVGIAPAATPAC